MTPCPFCLGTAVVTRTPSRAYRGECTQCGATGPVAPNKMMAEKLWNERAT